MKDIKSVLFIWFFVSVLIDLASYPIQWYFFMIGLSGHLFGLFAILIHKIDILQIALYFYTFTVYFNVIALLFYALFLVDQPKNLYISLDNLIFWIIGIVFYMIITGLFTLMAFSNFIEDLKFDLWQSHLSKQDKLDHSYIGIDILQDSFIQSHCNDQLLTILESTRFPIDIETVSNHTEEE
eukprot:NODE_121_length_17861_cov_0.498480.p12 type:complete len:182 gc:universal NODE_121_length_17861_cov_0.498480:7365-7910(+)